MENTNEAGQTEIETFTAEPVTLMSLAEFFESVPPGTKKSVQGVKERPRVG